MEPSTVAGLVGAIALALIGLLGKSAAMILADRAKQRELSTAGEIETARQREARPWALMESRIADLEEALERVSNSNQRLQADADRLRRERDQARLAATDWEIAAKRAAARPVADEQ